MLWLVFGVWSAMSIHHTLFFNLMISDYVVLTLPLDQSPFFPWPRVFFHVFLIRNVCFLVFREIFFSAFGNSNQMASQSLSHCSLVILHRLILCCGFHLSVLLLCVVSSLGVGIAFSSSLDFHLPSVPFVPYYLMTLLFLHSSYISSHPFRRSFFLLSVWEWHTEPSLLFAPFQWIILSLVNFIGTNGIQWLSICWRLLDWPISNQIP